MMNHLKLSLQRYLKMIYELEEQLKKIKKEMQEAIEELKDIMYDNSLSLFERQTKIIDIYNKINMLEYKRKEIMDKYMHTLDTYHSYTSDAEGISSNVSSDIEQPQPLQNKKKKTF